MKIFWNKIPDKYKLDITHIGHWSGTGLVSFNTNNIIKLDSNNKNLCLLTYGQLRTFKNNFRNNLLELYPVYTEYENVYIFILLVELSSNGEVVRTVYKENCDYIENVCKEFNIKIGFIQDINNLNYKQEEINYCSKLLLQKSDDKKEFPNNFVLKVCKCRIKFLVTHRCVKLLK